MTIHKGKKHITSHGNCTGSSWRVKEYFEVHSRNESARNEDDGHTRTSSWQWWTQLINMYVNGWLQPDNRSKINKHEGLIPYVLRKLMLQYQHDDVRVRGCYGMPVCHATQRGQDTVEAFHTFICQPNLITSMQQAGQKQSYFERFCTKEHSIRKILSY